jgi:hypothetical protein
MVAYGWLADANPSRAGLMSAVVQVANGGPILFEADRLRPDPKVEGLIDWYFGSEVLSAHEGDFVGDLSEQSDDMANADLWDVLSPEDVRRGFLPALNLEDPANWRYANNDMRFTQRLLDHIQRVISDFLKAVEHIRPLRPEPKRVFLLDSSEQDRWQRQGQAAYLRLLRGELTAKEATQLNQWLKTLELGEEVNLADFLSSGEAKYGVRPAGVAATVEIVESSGNQVNLGDVGYGAAQVIPVVIQSILAPEGTLTLIEQPELHLHPGAQSNLADVFVEFCAPYKRYLIETHSEHLLLRLRLGIAKATAAELENRSPVGLKGDWLSAYFVDRLAGQSYLEQIEIDEVGEFTRPPGGFRTFFADDMTELVKLSDTRRQIKEAQRSREDDPIGN